ncbi:cytochrome b561 domain-containing protein 2-like [Anneissia japonica]|uniref:cytochrome b561 domain-containing protein 2-like n=1 Tax=Anneissia japonica TaxID=1529436 RepID=UPI0014256DBE|nr:cytochrome b561 domain-containing protein 2-like [Anneissia japonica]
MAEATQKLEKKTKLKVGICKRIRNFFAMVAHLIAIGFTGFIIYEAWPGSSLFSWHPTLMTLAFAFLMFEAVIFFSPESSLLPQASRKVKTSYHWITNTSALIAAAVGFTVIVVNKAINDKPHFKSWHGFLGLITLIYSVVQATGGVPILYHKFFAGRFKLGDLKLYHATSGLILFCLVYATLVLALYSNWFTGKVTGIWWYVALGCPAWLALVVMNQVTSEYLPRALKKPSQQY